MNTPTFAAPARISNEVFQATTGSAAFKSWFTLFNNSEYVSRGPEGKGYIVRGTNAVLRATAAAGFDVFSLGGDKFHVVRGPVTVA